MSEKSEAPAGVIQTRWVELVVGLVIVAIGLLVVYDSHRVGAGWGDDGPKSGYFPNMIGWILTAAGAWIAGETVFRWKRLASNVFVTFTDFKPVLAMFLPTVVYVILIKFIGIYVASALYIAGFMIFQGKYKWPIAIAVAVGVPLAIFVLFEIWFLVPLPKGPVEQILGF